MTMERKATDGYGTCEWEFDTRGFYETGCGQALTWEEPEIPDNGIVFCPYCGKRITVEVEPEPVELKHYGQFLDLVGRPIFDSIQENAIAHQKQRDAAEIARLRSAFQRLVDNPFLCSEDNAGFARNILAGKALNDA